MTLRYRYKRPTFLFDTCLYSVRARQHWCTVARPLRGFVPKKSNFCFLLCVQERQQRQRAPKQIRTAACLLPCLFASAALHFWRHAVDSGMDATDITRNTPCGESALLYACWLISRAIILLGRNKKKKRFICKIHRHQLVPGNRLENFRDNAAVWTRRDEKEIPVCLLLCGRGSTQRVRPLSEKDNLQIVTGAASCGDTRNIFYRGISKHFLCEENNTMDGERKTARPPQMSSESSSSSGKKRKKSWLWRQGKNSMVAA